MGHLIKPEELPRWVPGELLRCSHGLGWKNVAHRTYRFQRSDVFVPGMADFVIVSYKDGSTLMERRFEGRWTRTVCHPGDISLLTRSQLSYWHWTEPIDVTHTYLSDALVASVATDVLDRTVAEVRLHDLLCTQDPLMTAISGAIAQEAGGTGIGGALYVEALSTQLVVHLLRRYASVEYRDQSGSGKLPPALCRRLREHIDSRLDQTLTLDDLATLAGMGVWSLTKRFRASFGTTPHHFIMDRRVDRARQLLAHGQLPPKAVASACGFADQPHLTRAMRSRFGTTPAALRRDSSR